MTSNFEYLKNLYESYSDDEVIRLYTSGNLTEEAEKVALSEIKVRKLTVPSQNDSKSSAELEHAEQSIIGGDMKVIANNLRIDEAIILSGLMVAEGIPSDTGMTTLQNALFPSGFNGVVRVDEAYLSQAEVVFETHKKNSQEEEESKNTEETEVLREFTEEEKELIKQHNRRAYMVLGFIFAALIIFSIYAQAIFNFIRPYITPNIFNGLLLVASYLSMKHSLGIHKKGGFNARDGSFVKREDSPISFWVEVAGGYIVAAVFFTYGAQYFFGLSILPTSEVGWDNLFKVVFDFLLSLKL